MSRVIPAPIVGQSAASGAQVIDGSLRFDSNGDTDAATSQRLARTFGSAGDNQKMTMSVWVKRTVFTSSNTDSGTKTIFGASGTGRDQIRFEHNSSSRGDQLSITLINDANTANECFLSTGPRFRDPSAWYHVVWAIDTTQGTPADRVKLYVNGTQITDFSGNNTQPGQNFTINCFNNNVAHEIGRDPSGSNQAYDGYMSNFYWIDGQQLDASYFGFTDPLTNTWRPKKYTGTFGTNGFWLPLDGNSYVGKDKSGRGNNWTPVVFRGAAALDKATGALPILNTVSGGRIATVGVRPDPIIGVGVTCELALPFSGNANDVSHLIDNKTTQKTTTVNGGMVYESTANRFYYYDGCYKSSGANSTNVTVGSAGDFNFLHDKTTPFTIEFWFDGDSVANSDAVFDTSDAGATSHGVFIGFSGGHLRFVISNGSTNEIFDPAVDHSTGQWYHYAVTFDGSRIRIFVDGIKKVDSTYSLAGSTSNHSGALTIFSACISVDQVFDGYMSDVRVYSGVAKYTDDFIVGSSGAVQDENIDILPDTPSGVAHSSALTKVTDGAVYFDGTGDYLSVADSTDFEFGSGDFTIEAFALFRALPGSNGDTIVSQSGSNTNNRGWQLTIRDTANSVTNPVKLLYSTNGTAWANASGSDGVSTSRIYTDIWYHFAVTRSGNTWYLFVNGNQENSWTDSNSIFNTTADLEIGSTSALTEAANAFISNVRIIKGTALYTSSFTPPTAPLTNVTNTTLLCCKSNSSATAFDVSPGTITANGNAAANIFNPFTTDINTVRGQETGYCTLNPLNTDNISTFSDGNLSTVCSTGVGQGCSSGGDIGVSSGKWYCEMVCTAKTATNALIGICTIDGFDGQRQIDESQNGGSGHGYVTNGTRVPGGTSYGTTWDVNDVMGIAMDLDSAQNTVTFYKNGVSQGAINITNARYVFGCSNGQGSSSVTYSVNFGQKPFKYAPPEGFKTLCLANLPRPSKVALQPDKYFKTIIYSGDSSNNTERILGFQPDLVWIKNRTEGASGDVGDHMLFDSIRGVETYLVPNETDPDATNTNALKEFTEKGFKPGSMTRTNETGDNYVAWCWKAGGAAVTNNDGSASSQVSANRDSGFSIVTYTGQSSNFTWGHGLGVAPSMVIIKRRNTAAGWSVYHKSLGATKRLQLDQEAAEETMSYFQNTAPTDTVFSVTTNGGVGGDGDTYVAYCWSEIPGFSKFGIYTGNNNADGPFIHCGFKPAWVMWKQTNTDTDRHWVIRDSIRDVDNPTTQTLYPSLFGSEGTLTSQGVDFLSNGFKIRSTWDYQNASNRNYIFAAFAEAPTQNLYGAQANAR